MFKCDYCGKITSPYESMTKKPIEFRKKNYKNSDGKIVFGWEIVKEGKYCSFCKDYINSTPPFIEELLRSNFILKRRNEDILEERPKKKRSLHDTQIKKDITKLRKRVLIDKWKDQRISKRILYGDK
jgi:hypothetical protein